MGHMFLVLNLAQKEPQNTENHPPYLTPTLLIFAHDETIWQYDVS
jgi:hypothetical protein